MGHQQTHSAEMTGPAQVFTGSTNVYSIPAGQQDQIINGWADGGSVVGGWGTKSVSIKAGNISGFVRVQASNNCGTTISKKAFTTTNCSALQVKGTITNYQCEGGGWNYYVECYRRKSTIHLRMARRVQRTVVATTKDVTLENGHRMLLLEVQMDVLKQSHSLYTMNFRNSNCTIPDYRPVK